MSEPPHDQSTAPVKAPKKSARARRKLQLDEEQEERPPQKRTGAPKTASVEDTFIFGLKLKRGRPRRQEAEPISEDQLPGPVLEEIHTKRRTNKAKKDAVANELAGEVAASEQADAAPPKRGRPKKAMLEVESEPAATTVVPDPSTEHVKPANAAKRKAVLKKGPKAVVLHTRTQQAASHDIAINSVKKNKFPDVLPEIQEITELSKAAKAKSAARIKLPLPVVEITDIAKPHKAAKAKPAAKKASKRSIDEATAHDHDQIIAAVEPTAKRPRRQAAINATQKVVLSYEEGLVPTDKLRRAPESAGKSKAASRKPAAPKQPSPPPSIPTTFAENSTDCAKVEDVILEARPAERGRNPARPTTKINIATSSAEIDVESTRAATGVSSETIAQSGKETSPLSQPLQVDSACNTDAQPVKRKAQIAICEQTPAALEKAELPQQAATKKRPTKTRRVLAESDVNIVRASPLKHTEKPIQCASPPAEPQDKYRQAATRPSKKQDDIKRSRKPQPAKQPILTPETEPTRGKPASSKKRHIIAADEDLDWLFEKPETKRPCPTTTRQAASKPRRKETGHIAKDMDLDDLLESIAGFSGKLLTGKRGRAVAS